MLADALTLILFAVAFAFWCGVWSFADVIKEACTRYRQWREVRRVAKRKGGLR